MTARRVWITGIALLVLPVLALWTSSLIVGAPMQQANPTEQQQTINAAIAQRFGQTSTVQTILGATQTIEAAFNGALTATAGFDATVNAAFANAASATAGAPLTQNAATASILRTQVAATAFAGQTRIAATALAASATANMLNTQVAYQQPTSQNTLPSGVGKIVFVLWDSNLNGQIYVMGDDRSEPSLISSALGELNPNWSPDGRHITFSSQETGRPQVFVMNADGSNEQRISDGTANDVIPFWSPDGKWIAFSTTKGASLGLSLYLMDSQGSNIAPLFPDSSSFGAWSPDGKQAIINHADRTYVIDLASRVIHPLIVQGFEDKPITVSDWSPNGQQIAFSADNFGQTQAYIANIDGTNAHPAVEDNANNYGLKWSADGTRFIFASERQSTGGDLYIASADGSNALRLTDNTGGDTLRGFDYWTPPDTTIVSGDISPSSILVTPNQSPLTGSLSSLYSTTEPTQAGTSSFAGIVTTSHLSVRRGPGPEYDEAGTLLNGATITVVGRNADGTWVQLNTGDPQWVNASFTSISGNISDLPVTFQELGDWGAAGIPTGVQAVAEDVLRVRGGPGAQYRQLSDPDTIKAGTVVDVIGQSADGSWYQVNIGDKSGWINAQYVHLTGNSTVQIPITSPSDGSTNGEG